MNNVFISAVGLTIFLVTSLVLGTDMDMLVGASVTWIAATLITKVNE